MDHGLVTKPWMFFFEKSELHVGRGFTGLAQSHGSLNSHVARWSGEQGFYSSLINLLDRALIQFVTTSSHVTHLLGTIVQD